MHYCLTIRSIYEIVLKILPKIVFFYEEYFYEKVAMYHGLAGCYLRLLR